MSAISAASSADAMLLPAAAPALGRGEKAAREFEAQLIGTVLESLEKTFATLPGEDAMAGEDDYNYLGTEALATGLAAGGGFGIARLISEHLPSEHAGSQQPISEHQISEHQGARR
jgi:Rod binding domain-containing protein